MLSTYLEENKPSGPPAPPAAPPSFGPPMTKLQMMDVGLTRMQLSIFEIEITFIGEIARTVHFGTF